MKTHKSLTEFVREQRRLNPESFTEFKNNDAAQNLFHGLGLPQYLYDSTSWDGLRASLVAFNGRDAGLFVDRARRYAGRCSSGEGVLLRAVLYVTNFAWLADELDQGETWSRMGRVSGSDRRAVALCVSADI